MKFGYDFWKDFATIVSYFLFAFSLIAPHITGSKMFAIFIGFSGIIAIAFCGIQMVVEENKKAN